ncbi:unnamed protein product [Discosporangium mesarthrocarpum]
MQVGFAMLEVGTVSSKNSKSVLLKNIGDATLGAISWWLVGYGLAYGGNGGGFVGSQGFALKGANFDGGRGGFELAGWVFSWSFAGDVDHR